MAKTKIRDPEQLGFTRAGPAVLPDGRGRITLPKSVRVRLGEGVSFATYVNDAGQVVLDPVVELPMRERWIYQNPRALAALKAGLNSAVDESLVDLGSFAKHADDD